MVRIQADQIEVGAGPQHAITKYGPGPGWELVASRIRDTGAVISIPGQTVNIGDAALNNGSSLSIDDTLPTVILASGRSVNKNARLAMECEDAAQAILSAKQSTHTASLALQPDPTGSSNILLGFTPTGVGNVEITAATIDLNATSSLKKNGVSLGVVDDVQLTQQTGNAGGDLNAPASGLYRVSYYLVTTAAGTSGTVKATFSWNDGVARTVDSATVTFGTLADPASGTLIVLVPTGNTVGYQTTVTDSVGDPEYALYITLEQLQ